MILTSPTKHFVRLSTPLVCSLVLALVLVACGGGSATSSAPAPQPTTATQSTATSESTSNTTTYTGNGFTIDYPQDWKTSTPSNSSVNFNNPPNTAALDINIVDNPNGQSAADGVSATLQKFQSDPKYLNFQIVDMPATTTVGGESWSQGSATYDQMTNGQTTSYKVVLLVDNHSADPSTPKAFIIAYVATADLFDQANNDDFQPMLQSFAFA